MRAMEKKNSIDVVNNVKKFNKKKIHPSNKIQVEDLDSECKLNEHTSYIVDTEEKYGE